MNERQNGESGTNDQEFWGRVLVVSATTGGLLVVFAAGYLIYRTFHRGDEKLPPIVRHEPQIDSNRIPTVAIPVPTPEPEKPTRQTGQFVDTSVVINLVYDDTLLSDDDRGRLILLIARDSDREEWKTAESESGDEDLRKLIEKNYAISREINPKSFDVLRQLIADRNPEFKESPRGGVVLWIPPVPMRTDPSQRASPGFIRFEDAHNHLFAAESLGDVRSETTELRGLFTPRLGSTVAKQLTHPKRLVDQAWATDEPVLPPGVHAFGDRGKVHIVLLNEDKRICDDFEPSYWVSSSPFADEMKERIEALKKDQAAYEQLLQKSRSVPLVIIDWDSDSNTHGQKVYSVAKYVLSELGLGALAVEFVELNPKKNYQQLFDAFKLFRKDHYCLDRRNKCDEDDENPHTQNSEKWLRSPTDEFVPDQLVLESIFWKYFKAQKAWVNLSFSVKPGAFDVMKSEFLTPSSSFGLAAANDRHMAESLEGVPQKAASNHLNFVNVTYGSMFGRIDGAFSNDENNLPVSILGPGCMFNFESVVPSDAGTSFSSPYVATWAWIKYLLDGTDPFELRKALIRASWVPPIESRLEIESIGVFDPPRLLSPLKPHVSILGGKSKWKEVEYLSKGTLTLQYQARSGKILPVEYNLGDDVTITVFYKNQKVIAHIRQLVQSPFPLTQLWTYYPVGISFDAFTQSNRAIAVHDLRKFADTYAEVVF